METYKHITVNEEIHKQIKIEAARHNKSIKAYVEDLIKKEIQAD